MKTAKGTYHRCIEFEEKAASIYLQLASRFSSDRRLSAFWLEMAMEENERLIASLRKQSEENPTLKQVLDSLNEGPEKKD